MGLVCLTNSHSQNIVALPCIANVWARIDLFISSEELSAMDRPLFMSDRPPSMPQGVSDEEDDAAPSWWDAHAAFYDDPDFVRDTPLRNLNSGSRALGPHPLAGVAQPGPDSEPRAGPETVSSSPSTPTRVLLWAAGTLRLIGRWAIDLTGEFAGQIVVRVTGAPSSSATESRAVPIVLD